MTYIVNHRLPKLRKKNTGVTQGYILSCHSSPTPKHLFKTPMFNLPHLLSSFPFALARPSARRSSAFLRLGCRCVLLLCGSTSTLCSSHGIQFLLQHRLERLVAARQKHDIVRIHNPAAGVLGEGFKIAGGICYIFTLISYQPVESVRGPESRVAREEQMQKWNGTTTHLSECRRAL